MPKQTLTFSQLYMRHYPIPFCPQCLRNFSLLPRREQYIAGDNPEHLFASMMFYQLQQHHGSQDVCLRDPD